MSDVATLASAAADIDAIQIRTVLDRLYKTGVISKTAAHMARYDGARELATRLGYEVHRDGAGRHKVTRC